MGPTIKTKIALALEATVAACALLGGVRLTWTAMEYGWARLSHRINACYLPARWAPPARVTSTGLAVQPIRDADPIQHYEVERFTLFDLANDLPARRIYIVPAIRKDRVIGFRISGVRPEGPFARIGLQDGDVVVAINGLKLATPDKALEVYRKLRNANHYSIEIERAGRRITIDVRVT
jgi:membrane-associated protease RseP (regulator of RpoE activity)